MLNKSNSHLFLYYPLAVNGYEKVLNSTFSEVWANFTSKPLYFIVGIRVVNLVNTFLPTIPLLKIVDFFNPMPTIHLHKVVDISSLPLAYHYFHSLSGNLTLLVFIFFVFGMIKTYRIKKYQILSLIVLLPIIFTDLFYGWIVPGLARQTLQPIIPLLILIGIWYINSSKYRKYFLTLILLLTVTETIIFIYSYYNYFLETEKFLDKIGVLNSWVGQKSAYNIFFKTL
jgi:hypothetical protein